MLNRHQRHPWHAIVLAAAGLVIGCTPEARAQAPDLWWSSPIPGATAFDAAVGDVDGDGDPDAVQVHLLNEGFVFLNDGAGTFTTHPSAARLPTAAAVAMGDLDGNGSLDLLIGRSLSACEVWTNNGTGAFFSTGQAVGPGTQRRAVALADVNGDGALDAILPSESATTASEIWTNNGAGGFAFAQTVGSNVNRAVAVADLNGDSFPDLVFGVNGGNPIWTNDGTGAFFDTGGTAGSGSTYGIALGDLNGDSHLDVFVANGPNEANEVWFNDGTGAFTNSGQALGTDYSFCVALTDVDGDNDLDALVGNTSGQTNQAWRNNGTGVFSRAPAGLGLARAFDIQPGDLDGDGDTDYFVTVNAGPSEVWLRKPLAEGGPLADSGQRIGGIHILEVTPGDFNGDGNLDLAYGALGQIAGLLTNNGFGGFAPALQTLHHGVNIGAIDRIDVNLDGDPDLVVGLDQSFDSNSFNRIWLNNGAGVFTPAPPLPGSRATLSLAVADLDGNGHPDIVEGNRTTAPLPSENPTNRIHFNLGGGTWSSVDALGGGWTEALAVGDLNGDGRPDIVVGNKDIPSTIWTNHASTQYVNTGVAYPSNVQDVVLADFDGNGALDVFFVANPRSTLFTNDGNGAFSVSSSNFNTTAFLMRAAAPDLDGDGRPDLWLGYASVGAVQDRYYLNDGSGGFAGFTQVAEANLTSDLAVGDFTGDGIPDLFSAGSRGDSLLWVRELALGPVEQYAASFGLTGPDLPPLADPEGDGVPNVMEYAYNMNPAVVDAAFVTDPLTATQGLPWVTFTFTQPQPTLVAHVIRLIHPTNLAYHLEAGAAVGFTGVTASVSSTPLNAAYERATYEYPVPHDPPNQVGRFRIEYTPAP